MADRRNLLGTGAVLVGLGSALISGAGVAAADSGDGGGARQPGAAASDGSSGSGSASGSASASAVRGHRGAAGVSAGVDASAGASVRGSVVPVLPVADAPMAVEVTKNSAPVVAAGVQSVSVPAPAAAVAAAPAAAVEVSPPVPAPVSEVPAVMSSVSASAAQVAPVADVVVGQRGGGAPVLTVSSPAPAATAAAAGSAVSAPAAGGSVADVLSGVGLLGSGGAVVGTPALTAFSGQVADPGPAAVVGTSLAAAAPPNPGPKLPALPTNGVSGVQIGHSQLTMPGSFIGPTVPADWYFPTQVDGSIQAQGVIWLQHGFGATNVFYSALATELAAKTNSIVVAPTLSSIPFTFSGSWLNGAGSQEAAAAIMLDPNRTDLVKSAQAAGFVGNTDQLKGKFVLAGHSAGGGFASAVGADYVNEGSAAQDANLTGVVMFDGVSMGTFTDEVKTLVGAGKPIYQIAAPAQIWNAFGATTNQLLAANPGKFDGVVLVNGSHVDSMLGVNWILDTVLQLVAGKVPAGNTAATYALSTGWINDFYAGATPQAPQYGLYAGANQQIIFGNAAGIALPTPTLNQIGPIGGALKSLTDVVFKLFGIPPTPEVNTGSNGVLGYTAPPKTNGVTGVKTGSADLVIPSGKGYNAPADWYFPTQHDGTVAANGIIWLQHGFLSVGGWYSDMARQLAQETNSIVVTPNIFWFDPLFEGEGEAIAEMFTGTRPALNISANQAGFQGTLPEKFILSGHSAGGRLATTIAGYTVDNGAAKDLLGVVMFDGVPRDDQLKTALSKLDPLDIPLYQIAAPPLFGGATEDLALLHPGQFIGVQIDGGTHTDSVSGNPIADFGSALFIGATPPGGKEAVRTFATGWVNDFYARLGATTPQPKYGIYGDPNNGVYQPNRPLVMGEASATTLPAPPPVDLNKYSGTWYEQGSVKQLFELGLVNVKAVYTLQPDGSIKVQNSGNLFGPNGPQSGGTATAVPVNPPTNTRLNVGFFFGTPKATEPGNYTILDYDPNYNWVIVSDPSRLSGWILTRDQEFRAKHPDEYAALVTRAEQLGVRLRITPSEQYPASSSV